MAFIPGSFYLIGQGAWRCLSDDGNQAYFEAVITTLGGGGANQAPSAASALTPTLTSAIAIPEGINPGDLGIVGFHQGSPDLKNTGIALQELFRVERIWNAVLGEQSTGSYVSVRSRDGISDNPSLTVPASWFQVQVAAG